MEKPRNSAEPKDQGSYFDITPILERIGSSNGACFNKGIETFGSEYGERKISLDSLNEESRLQLQEEFELELAAMGLSVEESNYDIFLHLKITNLDQFIGYLKKINTGKPSESQMDGIKKVIENSYNHVTHNAIFESKEGSADILIEFVSSIDEFKEQCKKLDPDGSKGIFSKAENMGKVVEIAKQGYLKEYLTAEMIGLLYGPEDEYSIANVHKPMLDGSFMLSADPEGPRKSTEEILKDSLDNYKGIWDRTIATVREIKNGGNEKAKDLLVKIFSNLKASIDYIEEDLYNSSPLYFEAKDFLSNLMKDVRKKLEDLERS